MLKFGEFGGSSKFWVKWIALGSGGVNLRCNLYRGGVSSIGDEMLKLGLVGGNAGEGAVHVQVRQGGVEGRVSVAGNVTGK